MRALFLLLVFGVGCGGGSTAGTPRPLDRSCPGYERVDDAYRDENGTCVYECAGRSWCQGQTGTPYCSNLHTDTDCGRCGYSCTGPGMGADWTCHYSANVPAHCAPPGSP